MILIFIPIIISFAELIYNLKQPMPEVKPPLPYDCKIFKIMHKGDNNQEDSDDVQVKSQKKNGKIALVLKILILILLITVLSVVVYVNCMLNKLQKYSYVTNVQVSASNLSYSNINETDSLNLAVSVTDCNVSTTLKNFDESMLDVNQEDIMNILLIGSDTRDDSYDDIGNTDSMILVSLNTKDKNIKLTSFMRDTYVTIPGYEKNRLNVAFSYGGPDLLFKTLKYNFDVDVDKYICVNFDNFEQIIDEVGGVDIELTKAEAQYMNQYSDKYNTDIVETGLQTLDGNQALSYARCRKIDSDFYRTERQRKVIKAFVNKIKGCNVLEINNLLNNILPLVYTNVSKLEILSLMVNSYSYLNNEIETLNVPIDNSSVDVKVDGMSVLVPNFEINKKAIQAHVYSTYKLEV